jgi:hypothetical protein
MALRSLAIAACFIAPLFTAEAAQKMRPPLPKPKPVVIAAPAPSQDTEPEASKPQVAAPEPEMTYEPPTRSRSGIIIPRQKPAELQKPEPQVPAVNAPDLSEPEIASPEPKEDQSARVKSAIVIPRQKPFDLRKPTPKPDTGEGQSQEKPDAGEEFATCRQELAALGAKFKVPAIVVGEMKCTVRNPVQITSISSSTGEVDFPGQPILNCMFAKRFTTWVSDVAGPVVKAETGEALAAISTGPGYECRGRNGDGSGKISEHAFGNAIDIASFKLKSKESMPVANVAKAENVESRWLMALRVSACGYFTTVLGPGSNAAHAEHYHFDLALHGRSSNYRICE